MKKPETSKKGNENKAEEIKLDSYGVNRVKMWDNGGVTFDLTLNGVTIYGCNVVEGKEGDFISFPARKGSNNKYYSIAYAKLSSKDQSDILSEVERQLNA